jgi:hypothetical protein
MNNLEKYVDYLQPVVKAINEHHNQFHLLWYYNLSAEDLFAEDGLVEFQTQDKNRPEHFSGNIPMVYAQWGEETGASMVLEISPEQRKLLSPDVLDVIKTEHLEYHEKWRKTADKTVYLLMDHEYFQTCAGFAPSEEFEDTVAVGNALDFLSHRLCLPYFLIEEGYSDLDYILWASSYTNA